jgi:hypothetical protein
MHVYFNKIILTTVFFLSLMVIISCETSENPSSPDGITGKDGGSSIYKVGASVSGQGSITIRPGQSSELKEILTVQAVTHGDGSVTGNGTLKYNPTSVFLIKFDIVCLSVIDNEATMEGIITKFPSAPEAVGQHITVKVEDNGEGGNAPPDKFGINFGGGPEPCDFASIIIFSDVETGSFQVNQ